MIDQDSDPGGWAKELERLGNRSHLTVINMWMSLNTTTPGLSGGGAITGHPPVAVLGRSGGKSAMVRTIKST